MPKDDFHKFDLSDCCPLAGHQRRTCSTCIVCVVSTTNVAFFRLTTIVVINVGHFFLSSRHEDIRDAILSLVTIFRDNSDKLERHEFRERQLGEQLKKALAGLDKRYKSQDQNIEKLAALMLRFDEKMKNFDIQMKEVRKV